MNKIDFLVNIFSKEKVWKYLYVLLLVLIHMVQNCRNKKRARKPWIEFLISFLFHTQLAPDLKGRCLTDPVELTDPRNSRVVLGSDLRQGVT